MAYINGKKVLFSVNLDGYEAGKQAEYDAFWDTFQENGNRRFYEYAFNELEATNWGAGLFKPKYDIIFGSGGDAAYRTFRFSKISNIKSTLESLNIRLDFSQATKLQHTFHSSESSELPNIDLSSCTELNLSFYDMKKLTKLNLVNLCEDCACDRAFIGASSLEDLSIVGTIGQNGFNFSQNYDLSHDSLMNIINCLMDYVIADSKELTGTTNSVLIASAKLIEGKTYSISYNAKEFYDGQKELEFTDGNLTASTIDIPNVGERVGIWQSMDYLPDPDTYYHRLYVYQDGDDIKELRCRIRKADGACILYGGDGDVISVKVDQTDTHTVTLGATNLAKLKDNEKAIATEKGWTLA